MQKDDIRVEITDDDVRAAKEDWLRARDGDVPADRVERHFRFYVRLISTQAQQFADDFRRR